MIPKHEVPPTGNCSHSSSAFASRDVSCVTCRACDVARDRSIGGPDLDDPKLSLDKFWDFVLRGELVSTLQIRSVLVHV